MQTVLYIEKIGDFWTWLIERRGGSVQDSRFRTPFSTCDAAERAARIWAEVHEVPIDRIDFGRPPATKPQAPYPTEPGALLTWQEAQRRVDAGLGVETLKNEISPEKGWRQFGVGQNYNDGVFPHPDAFKNWTYRVPAKPAREAWAGVVSAAVNEAATALTLEEMRQMSLSIGRLTHELEAEKQDHAKTKTELAAARDRAKELESRVNKLSRLPDQIEQVRRWHTWADTTLGLRPDHAISATEKQRRITLKIQELGDSLTDRNKTFAKIRCML